MSDAQPEDIDGQALIDEAMTELLTITCKAVAVLHKADVGRLGLAICAECSQEGEPVFWPCDTVRLIAELASAEAEA